MASAQTPTKAAVDTTNIAVEPAEVVPAQPVQPAQPLATTEDASEPSKTHWLIALAIIGLLALFVLIRAGNGKKEEAA